MARNNGIARAKGDYLLMVDPDDYVLPNTFKQVLKKVQEQDLDVLYLGFEIFDAAGKSIWQTDYSQQEQQLYDGVEGYFASRGQLVKDPDRSWAILYRNELLKKFEILYPKDVPFLEDGVFIAKVFSKASKVGFSNQIFYQRTTSIGSATVTGVMYSEKAINGFLLAVQNLKQFETKWDLKGETKGLMNHVVAKYVLLAVTTVMSTKNYSSYRKLVKQLKVKGYKKLSLNGLRMDYVKLVRFFNFNPYLFLLYHPLYIRFFRKLKSN
jgi:glycosyltransferase involved in cell wall biosynthesis